MLRDNNNSTWVSHSSINDFIKCPRLYFLRNIYKNQRGRKIAIVTPHLSLGKAVHDTLEGLAEFAAEKRFAVPLHETFERNWRKISGISGGFKTIKEEDDFKERGMNMIRRVNRNPGPLLNKTIKLKDKDNGDLLNIYLSKKEEIVLCGKIDWLEYVDADDTVRVIDFKTGKSAEKKDSLQLPIYALLLNKLQKRKISGASYWYVDKEDRPTPVELPNVELSYGKVLAIAQKVKTARDKKQFDCPNGEHGCYSCGPFERILQGRAEFVGVDENDKEIYIV